MKLGNSNAETQCKTQTWRLGMCVGYGFKSSHSATESLDMSSHVDTYMETPVVTFLSLSTCWKLNSHSSFALLEKSRLKDLFQHGQRIQEEQCLSLTTYQLAELPLAEAF